MSYIREKSSKLFKGRRVRSPEDVVNIIRDFIGDSDREKFVVLCMNTIIHISEVLFQKYGFYVPIAEIDYESSVFYKEEIDELKEQFKVT